MCMNRLPSGSDRNTTPCGARRGPSSVWTSVVWTPSRLIRKSPMLGACASMRPSSSAASASTVPSRRRSRAARNGAVNRSGDDHRVAEVADPAAQPDAHLVGDRRRAARRPPGPGPATGPPRRRPSRRRCGPARPARPPARRAPRCPRCSSRTRAMPRCVPRPGRSTRSTNSASTGSSGPLTLATVTSGGPPWVGRSGAADATDPVTTDNATRPQASTRRTGAAGRNPGEPGPTT